MGKKQLDIRVRKTIKENYINSLKYESGVFITIHIPNQALEKVQLTQVVFNLPISHFLRSFSTFYPLL